MALAVSGTNLYAGGQFTTAGGIAASHIAKWNGTVWADLDGGLNGSVYALAVSGTDLYVGGEFSWDGYIDKWDGNAWSALGSGMNNWVYALAVSGTDLYAAGWFTSAGGAPANYIAKWDGGTWSALGSGKGGVTWPGVSALAVSGADLYAGGSFTTAGGKVSAYVAKATLPAVPVLTLGEALDAPQLTWSSGGDAPWRGELSTTHDGADAAQSGTISDSQETWVETSVVGPGSLSFWWKVSSESGYDYLEFYTNSVRVTRISGEVDWEQQSCTLWTGTQVLRWRYMKDSSSSDGQDRSWLDQVSFAPVSARPIILVNDGSFGMSSNRFGFNVTGTASQVVIVEGSTNLSTWLPLLTNTLGSGPLYFSDPATSAFPGRFYRARVGP